MNCPDEFCRRCALNTVCSHEKVCSDYSPISSDRENEAMAQCAENNREEYRSAWMRYIKFDEDEAGYVSIELS